MKVLANLSPMQLASLALAGGFAADLVIFLPIGPDSHLRVIWIPLGISIFIAGFLLLLKAPSELENGIAAERWPAAQLEKVRSIVNSPAVTILMVGFLVAYASMAFLHNSFRHIAWSFILPVQAINLLRIACKEPKPQSPFESADWKSIPPLKSEHWGER